MERSRGKRTSIRRRHCQHDVQRRQGRQVCVAVRHEKVAVDRVVASFKSCVAPRPLLGRASGCCASVLRDDAPVRALLQVRGAAPVGHFFAPLPREILADSQQILSQSARQVVHAVH
jgi:hypothetical protein